LIGALSHIQDYQRDQEYEDYQGLIIVDANEKRSLPREALHIAQETIIS